MVPTQPSRAFAASLRALVTFSRFVPALASSAGLALSRKSSMALSGAPSKSERPVPPPRPNGMMVRRVLRASVT
ncbi:hypothetical protein C6N75_25700 [Streptomyces solincola]|uniref:Uncharacterized protein n=1 Tax=Streptomyces solincola TaxID=2100817 RepID=A0A2S9PPS6_9ACTN|nr:hypothetical protein C6N75_25700 [Streptomyces solincola]